MSRTIPPAQKPEQLGEYFVSRANAQDLDGLVALYEPTAILHLPDGGIATGSEEIRRSYEGLVAHPPQLTPGTANPTIINGDLALTSTRLATGGCTAEVARRQADGSWLWILDNPAVV